MIQSAERLAAVRRFVRARYGLRGTLALHRQALGWDLLRAPVNVALSPVFLILRLAAALLSRLGARRAGAWLAARRIFLTSNVARRITADLQAFVADLDARGIGPDAPPDLTRARIEAIAAELAQLTDVPAGWARVSGDDIWFGVPDDAIDAALDVTEHLSAKVAALRAHATQVQVSPDGRACALSNGVALPVGATEFYTLAAGSTGERDGRGWETDLLAGLSLG